MNKVLIIGNLTRDPELRQTNTGLSVCNFTVAVGRRHGENNETDFFSVQAWRGLADNCAKYLKKGKKVAVIGSLQNRSYEDKDGVKRTITEIIASDVEFLSPNTDENTRRAELIEVEDDDLPF